MNDVFNVSLEDDDGKVIVPKDPHKSGNSFAVQHLPRKGDEIQVNDMHYVVLDIIHEFHETTPAAISLRLKLKSVYTGEFTV
jgi:hypothetical protein